MASDADFVQFIVDQLKGVGGISSRNMFGEYVLYSNGKLFALICDNKLFIKPTPSGSIYIGDVVEAPPYPGAKPCFLIEEKLDDRDWLCELVRISLTELPEPKPKRKRKS